MHVFKEHLSHFGEKPDNFAFGIIKKVAPRNLDRADDFFIFNSRSDILDLNRKPRVLTSQEKESAEKGRKRPSKISSGNDLFYFIRC
jgi:hypothetical protein